MKVFHIKPSVKCDGWIVGDSVPVFDHTLPGPAVFNAWNKFTPTSTFLSIDYPNFIKWTGIIEPNECVYIIEHQNKLILQKEEYNLQDFMSWCMFDTSQQLEEYLEQITAHQFLDNVQDWHKSTIDGGAVPKQLTTDELLTALEVPINGIESVYQALTKKTKPQAHAWVLGRNGLTFGEKHEV